MQALARFWYRYCYPIWNWLPSYIQSFKYDSKSGRSILAYFRDLAPDADAIAGQMTSHGFEWTKDPWDGKLNFHQKPWVTCARHKGDCDDWAHLWAAIFKYHAKKIEFLHTQKKGGGGHLMCVVTMDWNCYLFSNLNFARKVPVAQKDDLKTVFYQSETDWSVFY